MNTDLAKRLINAQTYTDVDVKNEDGTISSMKDVITSDALVDIFDELYPDADDLDDNYDALRTLAFEMGLTIVPGEDIIEGFIGKK